MGKFIHVATLSMVVALVSGGCSVMGVGQSESTCSKDKDRGMPCASVAEVYKKTNGSNWKSAILEKEGATASVPQKVASVLPVSSPAWPTPVLEPAQVMRVWISPWVDDQQSLHWPSYVFMEVTPRKWSYGNSDFRQARQLTPVQIEHRTEPASAGTSTPASPIQPRPGVTR